MQYIYTAIITPFEDGTGYAAKVPDLPGCVSSGKDLYEAIDMITDAMSGWLVVAEDENVPIRQPRSQAEMEKSEGAYYALIKADTMAYRARTNSRAVRKNVSLPAWMATLAEKRHLNCSQILQEALMKILEG